MNGATLDNVSLYGFWGADSWVYFMSPWEMVQWWNPVQLPKPSARVETVSLTLWVEGADQTRAEPGVDYIVNDKALRHEDVVVLPEVDVGTTGRDAAPLGHSVDSVPEFFFFLHGFLAGAPPRRLGA